MDVAMTPEPAIVLRFVGVEIVEDDMDLVVRIIGDDPVHEVEELHPPATLLVSRQDLAIGEVEGGKERGGAVARVVMALTAERPSVGQLEVTLRPFERLDRRLLVDA